MVGRQLFLETKKMNRRVRNLLCLCLLALVTSTGCDLDIIVPGYGSGGYSDPIIEVIEIHDPYQPGYYQEYDFYVDF